MLANAIHLMNGVPYIYQGEEIGMTNPEFEKTNQYKDVESTNYYDISIKEGKSKEDTLHVLRKRSRDNSRTPVQWDDSKNAGFTQGEPWIEVASNYKAINVDKALGNKNSILNYYKKLIEIRKNEPIIKNGEYKLLLKEHNKVYAYERTLGEEKIIVVNNFYSEKSKINLVSESGINDEAYEVLISNYEYNHEDLKNIELKPYEAFAIKIK